VEVKATSNTLAKGAFTLLLLSAIRLIRPEISLLDAIEVPDSFTANSGAASGRRARFVHIHARHSTQDVSPH
jgi:hypothetical protein